VPGRARAVFTAHAETAGLEGPPRGALASYAEEILAQVPALRARCGEDDEETHHALREMEAAAVGLLAWVEQEGAVPRPSRAARGTARSAAQVPAVTRLAARAATRRAAMRSRR